MGIIYAAAKVEKPEAWEIGKDYYGLTDLFPPSAHKRQDGGFAGWVENKFIPKLEDLPHLVGSRHIVGNTPFRVTDFYQNADDMIAKIVDLKKQPIDRLSSAEEWHAFFAWAGSDLIQFIPDIDALEEREAEGEYQLCDKPSAYVYGNDYKEGENVGYGDEDYEEEDEQ